jgi:glucokinase
MRLSLIADIGGTNARFALWDGHQPNAVEVLAPDDFRTPADAVREYLSRVGKSLDELDAVCLACAGPVQGDHFRFTNNAWSLNRGQFCEELGLRQLTLINDFAAQAMGISRVQQDELCEIVPGSSEIYEPALVIGPGTGLGVGTLLHFPDGSWNALPGEGGHVDLPVANALEAKLWGSMRAVFDHVSAEHVLSGSGLMNLYHAFCDVEEWSVRFTDPAQITDAALAGDEQALRVVDQFCTWLGRIAGNNVLTLGARGGVYLTGGILPRIVGLLRKSGFTAAFSEKGQMRNYIKGIPVWLVTADQPGLMGTGVALQQTLARS